MKSLLEKFNAIDVITSVLSSDTKNFYLLSKVEDLQQYKKYEILSFAENEEEKSEYLQKINEITSKPDYISELVKFAEKNKFPEDKLERTGSIECKFLINKIDIVVRFEGEVIKNFTFRDEDYLDSFIDFMEKEYRELVNDKFLKSNL